MINVISIIGNRPHFIKLAPVSKALKTAQIKETIVHTGQHYDDMLSSHFIKELGINPPHYNLNVGSETPLIQFAKILSGLEPIFNKLQPDMVLVFGDTNSTAAGAIAAAKSNIPIAHIESGLREYDKNIPEEINKLLTDSVADLLFSPTKTGVKNLKIEGKIKNVYNVGDVGLDLIQQNENKILSAEKILTELNLKKNEFIFMTCHREANTNGPKPLKEILNAANKLNKKIVFPIHPRTKKAINKYQLNDLVNAEHWNIIEPIGFFDTQALIKNAAYCLTDSGGIIKESYFHKTPCIIIDKQTEWIEAVKEGWCQVCGPDQSKILDATKKLSNNINHLNSLGNGTASKQIVDIIVKYLSKEKE